MAKYKLEYIWLDGYEPVPNLRGKTQVKEFQELSESSKNSRCGALTAARPGRPKATPPIACSSPWPSIPTPPRKNGVLVMCEVMMPDGKTPHPSNARATILDDPGAWFGFEQEYFLYKDGAPLGFPTGGGFPPPQGKYYTGVGYENVGCIAREIVDTHLDLCLDAGINHEGINAEVAKGQWEFQIFGKGSKTAADQMWMARYLSCASAKNTAWT
jgi:glutamine synthetase